MTATLTVSGANTTIDFNYIGPNATIQGIADGACHRIWVSYGVGPVDGILMSTKPVKPIR